MKLVLESLDLIYDRERYNISPYLYMELLNEGIQFKNPKDAIQKATKILPNLTRNKRINLLTLLFLMNIGGATIDSSAEKEVVKDSKTIAKLADKVNPSAKTIMYAFDLMAPPVQAAPVTPDILKVNLDFISDLDTIKPGRFAKDMIDRYNKFDKEILQAIDTLKARGENPDADFIKAIMLIETGMNPTKNSLGYEGFPQTKEHIINGWTGKDGTFHPGINQRYGTDFTLKDMYDPGKAAEFIHYYTKALQKSKHVDSVEDMIIAYNWGTGNLGKYKNGKKDLPKESAEYVKMLNAMKKHFVST